LARVRHTASTIEKTTHIFTNFEVLEGVRTDVTCSMNMAYTEAAAAFALRR